MLRYKNLRSNVKGLCKNTWLRGTKIQDDSICDYEKVINWTFLKSWFVRPWSSQCCSVNAVDLSLSSSLRSWFGGVLRILHRLFARILLHLEATPCIAMPHGCHRAIAIQHHPAITIYSSLEFYWVPPPPWHGRELGRWDLITSHSNDSKLWSIYSILIQGRSCHHFDDLRCMITIFKVQFTVTVDNDYIGHPKACLTVFPALSLGLTRICASFKVFESSDPFPPNSLPQSNSCANSKAFICLRRKFGIACIHVVSLKFILYSISRYLESWGLCRIYYLWGILKLLQSVTGPPAAKRRILGESIWKQMQMSGFPVTRLSMLGRKFLNWSIISRY